jgi:hypothetical protein
MSKITVGCRLPLGLINGDIFAEATESKARGAAKERVKNKTGLEGADAEESGLKKSED